MDLLNDECTLDLFDHDWRIYSVNPNQPPQYISSEAIVKESLINEGCTIEGKLINRCYFKGLVLEKVQLSESLLLCQMQSLEKT